MKQYSILLKQILKGLSIEADLFEGLSSFEELLEFGSRHVVAMRKRQREEESNQKRNSKKLEYGISERS